MNRRPVIVAVAAALALVAGAAVYNATNNPTSDERTPSASAAPTTTPAPSGSAPAPVVLTPTVPGWSPVRSVKRAVVYDVPPAWKVFSEDALAGYEDRAGRPLALGSGASNVGEGACGGENNSLALAVTRNDTRSDITGIGTAYARQWADAAYRDDSDRPPAVTVAAPEQLTTAAGQQAVIVRATAAPASAFGACKVRRGAIYTITATGFRGELGPTVTLVVVAPEQITGAEPVPEAEIRRILSTLRAAP